MSDTAAPAGTSSTPATGETAPVTEPVSQPSATVTPAAAPTSPEATLPEPSKSEGTVTAKPPEADPAKTDQPLFTVPEGVKLLPQAQTRFETFVKGKMADGKMTLTPQELFDHYLEHATEMNTVWQQRQQDLDTDNKAECQQRFTPAQLAAAETGVGFLSSFEPTFREVAKSFLNHPTFVNAMRIVGERLSEDTFETGGNRQQPAKRAPKDVLYGKRN